MTFASLRRLLAITLLTGLSLQLFFLARVGLMTVVDVESTSFQRSEIWRLATSTETAFAWQQDSVPASQISKQLRRAVIASEDAGFVHHAGVEWDAIESAWKRNQKAEAKADKLNEQLARKEAAKPGSTDEAKRARPKVVGGSTISQQLAKNLFLSGERTPLRKGQEMLITFMLEGLLSKDRLLTIYLNNVEWGAGVFGAEAAAQHYFRVDAAHLSAAQAARLAVMLPAPKRFEKQPASPYVLGRAATIQARMAAVEMP